MKMQDKLIKYNHKAAYYRMKKCAISFATVVGFGVCVTVPVTISVTNQVIPEVPHAEVENPSVDYDETFEDLLEYEVSEEKGSFVA